MKKKLFTALAFVILACCMLVIGVSAETTVTDDGTNVKLGECTIANLDGVTVPSPTSGLQYTLDENTKTATVSGKGSFTGGEGVNLVIPSSVTYNDVTYTVTTVAGSVFNGGSSYSLTYNLYVPDSVTLIKGGAGNGAFGNAYIDKAYIGCGLTSIERETFSASKGFSTFICKSKPTYIGIYAFNSNKLTGNQDVFELDLSCVTEFDDYAFLGCEIINNINIGENVERIGTKAFSGTVNMRGSVVISETCELNTSCLNNAQSLELVVVKVAEGTTRTLPQEFLSNAGAKNSDLTIVISGKVTFAGYAALPGISGHKLYAPDLESIQTFADNYTSIGGSLYDRIEKLTVYCCADAKSYKISKDATVTEVGAADENHIYSELAHLDADCSNYERSEKYCYACGDTVTTELGNTYGEHVLSVTVKAPNCQSKGYSEYECTVCKYQYSADFTDSSEHDYSRVEYGSVNGSELDATYYCKDCGLKGESKKISLVNKCYIAGYGLFDATLDYVSVSADGVATPSAAAFYNAEIYFPSFVEVDGSTVEVKTVSGFKKYSIKSIYIPDTVTRIAGGGGVGCFGDILTLKNLVVGSGVTSIEQEVFCMANAITLDELIFTGTIEKLYKYAFRCVSVSADAPYKLDTKLTYVGYQVNTGGNAIRSAYITQSCDLTTEKFGFNGSSGLLTVYIEGSNDSSKPKELPQELFSNGVSGSKIYIKGYVTTTGQAVLPTNGAWIFMESVDAIDVFTSAIKNYGYSERLNYSTFFDCSSDTAWYVSNGADRAKHSSVSYTHGGVVVETAASCTQGGSIVESCFVCGEVVTTTEIPVTEHEYDGGVISSMPNCRDLGGIIYTCFKCGQSHEYTIFRDYLTHEYSHFIKYVNGFDKNGLEGDACAICSDVINDTVLDPILVAIGYSVKNDRTGIDGGYKMNSELLKKYESQNGSLSFGIIIVNSADAAANGFYGSDFRILSKKGIQVEMNSRDYSFFNLSITGFNNDTLKALDLLITAYVVADLDGDGVVEMSFVQYEMIGKDNNATAFGGVTLNTVSIDRAMPAETATAYTGKED